MGASDSQPASSFESSSNNESTSTQTRDTVIMDAYKPISETQMQSVSIMYPSTTTLEKAVDITMAVVDACASSCSEPKDDKK
jgi:hypothetical protein